MRESFFNLWASKLRTAVVIGVLTVALSLVGLAEAVVAHDQLALRADLRLAGQLVFTATRTDGTRLPVSSCRALAMASNVLRAGALTELETTRASKGPGDPIVVYTFEGDTPAIVSGNPELTSALSMGDVYLSDVAAAQLGVAEGGHIRVNDTTVRIADVLDFSARAPSLSLGLLQPGVDVQADECWVEIAESFASVDDEILQVLGADVNVQRVLPDTKFVSDPSQVLRDRPEQSRIWLAGAGGCVTVLTAVSWFRRREGALYRALGAGRIGATLVFTAEIFVLTSVASAWSVAATVIALDGKTGQLLALLAISRAAAAAIIGAALLAIAVHSFGSVVSRLKDS